MGSDNGPRDTHGESRTVSVHPVVLFFLFLSMGGVYFLFDDGIREGNSENLQDAEITFSGKTFSGYEDLVKYNRAVSSHYDTFHSKSVTCIRNKGVTLEELAPLDHAYMKALKMLDLDTSITVLTSSPEEKKLALQRVDDLMEETHRSYHPDGYEEEEKAQDTASFYDFATWMMQQWSGLQGYHYGIYDEECKCLHMECAMANLFIYAIAGMRGENKRVLDSGCGWSPLGRLLTYKFKGLKYTGITSSAKGRQIAEDFSEDYGYSDRAKIVKANFIKRLPFDDGSFDYIFNVESMFHNPDHFAYMREVGRLLAPGGEFRILDYFNPTSVNDLSPDERLLMKCVSNYWGYANFPIYKDFEEAAKQAGLEIKHRFDLHHKVYDFAKNSLDEDLEQIHRYVGVVANKQYKIRGLFSRYAFGKNKKLKPLELQNLSELLGSKCNDLLLANGGHHYTMYIVKKPE